LQVHTASIIALVMDAGSEAVAKLEGSNVFAVRPAFLSKLWL
jgi:hypothetical protein